MVHKRSCYVCGYSVGCYDARGLHFHSIPLSRAMQQTRDQWLDFLHLPPSSEWTQDLWKNIALCSRHFDEEKYHPQHQVQLRVKLRQGTAPTLNRPTGSGVFGEIFSKMPDRTCSDTNGPPITDTSPSGATENNDPVDLPDASWNQEDISAQLILNNERKELCRLCGQKASLLIPIFEISSSDSSSIIPVLSKIEMYLPFKVSAEDPLPYHICSNCCDILNRWHEFYVTSVGADTALWKIFGRETDVPANIDCTNASVEDFQQIATSITVEDDAEIQPIPPLPPPELKQKEGILHAENVESSRIEDRTFIVEFDRNFAKFRNISYKCKYCHEIFKNSTHRKNHFAKCRLLSTICELCGHEVPCRKDLRKHKYRKHDRKIRIIDTRYMCFKCSKCFKTTPGLKHHIATIHNTQDRSKKYFCELCCSAFAHEIYFQIHKRKHEKGKIKTTLPIEAFRQENNSENSEKSSAYSCPVCQEKFNDMLSLVVHLTTKKKIKCSLCHKVMSCEKRFFLHNCEVWTCQYCLMTFDQRIKWIVHERLHTGEKPIKCRVCDLTFRTWQARRRHENRHNSPYQCSYCGKSFKNKCSFEDHILCHEGKEFLCHICDKKFSGRINLKKHVRRLHKNVENVTL